MAKRKPAVRRARRCGPPGRGKREAPPQLPPAPDDGPAAGPRATRPDAIRLGVDPKKLDEAIRELRAQVGRWVQRGVADKVRISYKGKRLAPDIPVYYFLAAEALTFWATGFLRLLIVNLGAKALLEVELISSAEEHHAAGMEKYLAGDVDGAAVEFQKGADGDDYHAPSHLMLGVCKKVRGELGAARAHFRRAAELDPKGETGAKARAHLRDMSRPVDGAADG